MQDLVEIFNNHLSDAQKASRLIRISDKSAIQDTKLFKGCPKPLPLHGLLSTNDCKIFGNRRDLIKSIFRENPKIVAEIGVLYGDFSKFILENCPAIEKLYLIDRSLAKVRHDFSSYQSIISYLEGNSSEVISAHIPEDSLDLAYIDGDHAYRGVKRDTDAVVEKIKKGGYIIFNDYSNFNVSCLEPYGVLTCVHELLASQDKWKIAGLSLSESNLKDICLKKL